MAGFQVRDVIVHLFGEGVPRGRALDPKGKRKGAWSTLKPASEHWVLCKKPIAEGDLLSNVKKYGTGTLSIDDCRIPLSSNEKWISPRFPTNVMLTHDERCAVSCVTDCPVSEVDRQSGKESSRFFKRFYYCSKASESERRLGCGSNNHPTVKSVELMRYLLRLVTPHGGVVLDPFMGSGTTGIAAFEEGRHFVGIEKEKRYFSIANKRNKFVNPDCVVATRCRKQELAQLLTGRR
jgi:site-specific DNA-methyltransferase (adenine-specific)